ncbi:hypothetical protein GTP46_26755 [Duganella sp. FT135W]|uniref:DUF7673 domain-containing protein n=1 Tax=Duganella flavida TaxID=2692175 RepID=A0A6L8KGL0_9BURK|nr:hypothetical protein [Duganella flavida]MYM26235.1 hypothetical protein [Duganella flavida]
MQPSQSVIDAVDRLFTKAMWDTGQARKIAKFLMSWGNEPVHGGFDLAHIRDLDTEISRDMWTLTEYLFASGFKYPIDIGFEDRFVALVRLYRPDLFERKVFQSAAGEPDGDTDADSLRQAEHTPPGLKGLAQTMGHSSPDSLRFYLPGGKNT